MVATQQILAMAIASTAVILQGCDNSKTTNPAPPLPGVPGGNAAPRGPGGGNGGRSPYVPPSPGPRVPTPGPRVPTPGPRNPWRVRLPTPRVPTPTPTPPRTPTPPTGSTPTPPGPQPKSQPSHQTTKIPTGPPKPKKPFTVEIKWGTTISADTLYQNVKQSFISRLQFPAGNSNQGAGGFGAVHLATVKCQGGDRKTIVKVPTLSSCDNKWGNAKTQCYKDAIDEGKREVEMLKKVHGSPYFSQIYASVESQEKITSIMMEALRGDLMKLSYEVRRANDGEKMNWAMQLLRGIKVLHDQGLMHHDLKPPNAMLSEKNAAGVSELRIIDLGGACPVGRGVENRCVHGVHTFGWVPPEFYDHYFDDGHPDWWPKRSPEDMKKFDIYSAGLMIFMMFANRDFNSWRDSDYKYNLAGTDAFTWYKLDRDSAQRRFKIPVAVRDFLTGLLKESVILRSDINKAIADLQRVMRTEGVAEQKLTMTSDRHAPKCFKQCLDDGCTKTCFNGGNNGRVGNIDPFGNKQCVAAATPMPKVRETHFGEL